MARWQRRARLLIALSAIAFAAVLAFSFRNRAPAVEPLMVASTDPEAVVESFSGSAIRVNRDEERVRVEYSRLLTYADGSSRMLDVKVSTERAGGRTFTLSADEALVGQNESSYDLSGRVRLEATDGLVVNAEQAAYAEHDATVRVPGPVDFARGRMTGTGVGMTYNKNGDLLSILDQAVIRVEPDTEGSGGVEVASRSAMISRPEGIMRFEGEMRALRGAQVIEADLGIGHLGADAEKLETFELRGRAALTTSDVVVGGLERLSGRDIDLQFAPDGEIVQHALVVGGAVATVAGAGPGGGGRSISAESLDVSLAADGATPIDLVGEGAVVVVLPAEGRRSARTIRARSLHAVGDAGRGLTSARFAGQVQFQERGTGIDRSARSDTLEAALAPGLGDIEDAVFRGSVRFVDGDLTGTAAMVAYELGAGTLDLSGTGPSDEMPRVVSERLSVNARRIEVGLGGVGAGEALGSDELSLRASGTVTSELGPASRAEGRNLPSMLESEKPVIILGDELVYDAAKATATYTGHARLSQVDTSISADTLTLDETSGDLVATGNVVTTTVLEQTDGDKPPERVPSIARAEALRYDELARRAMYTGQAHVGGPQGDLSASRIELFLGQSGRKIDRAEAYEDVTLLDRGRKTTGSRLTYLAAEDRYVVSGTPVTAVDECGRATTGHTLTFDRMADRVIVDGTEQTRTRTQGVAKCP